MDGDGRADIAAGARFHSIRGGQSQEGEVSIWSGTSARRLRRWDGPYEKGLFGHAALPVDDLDGDGLADVFTAAPSAIVDYLSRGIVSARSPRSGRVLWTKMSPNESRLGWDLALAGDTNGDGRVDLLAGAPSHEGGRVDLLSGRDGSLLRSYRPSSHRGLFGWYVANVGDLDADGRTDLLISDPRSDNHQDVPTDNVHLLSGATGKSLHVWQETDVRLSFGEMVTALGDLDGDGRGEVVLTSSCSTDRTHTLPGFVQVFSGTDYREIRRWEGKQPGESYGRMAVSAGDVDGDGVEDLAIGAPWHAVSDVQRVGRVEIRSGKSGKVLAEWFGQGPDDWFGWHIRRAPDPEGRGRPALLIGSLRRAVDGKQGVGVIDLYVLQSGTVAETANPAPGN